MQWTFFFNSLSEEKSKAEVAWVKQRRIREDKKMERGKERGQGDLSSSLCNEEEARGH